MRPTPERPKREPIPRAREAASWLGGILLLGVLGGGVVAAAVMLWENIDLSQVVPELAEAPPAPALPALGAPATAGTATTDVALFVSPRNAAFYPDSAYHPRTVAAWMRLLTESGLRVRRISTTAELSAVGRGVVVVPETPCLSGDERAALSAHVRRGGHLVADWAVGARDETCRWLGWELTQALAGAADVREIPPRDGLYLAVPSGLPFSPGLDPGTRVELRPDPSLAARIDGARVYWADWALDSAPDESGGGADAAAVARRTDEGGRIVWLGFRLGQGATPRDGVLLARIVRNGVLWAAGTPVAEVAPWPGGRRAALMLAVDVEAQPANALPLATRLAADSVPATWFAVSARVADRRDLSAALAPAGEVGAQTPDNAPVAGLEPAEQQVRLRRVAADLEDWSGVRPRGLRPPDEAFDQGTLDGWERAGGAYLVGLNDARSASPERHWAVRRGDSVPMILLPRLVKDDYNVFVQDGAMRSSRLADAWREGRAKLRALGGIAVLVTHTQTLDSDARREVVTATADSARAEGGWWLATGSGIASWWRARAAAGVRATGAPGPATGGAGDGPPGVDARHAFTVTAGPEGLVDGWLDVVVPEADGLVPLRDGDPVRYELTPWGLRVPLGDLEAGEERTVGLVPAPESGGGGPGAPGTAR